MLEWQSVTAYEFLAPISARFKICCPVWFGSFCCLYLHSLPCDRYPLCTRRFGEMDFISGWLFPFGPVMLFVVALHENTEERPFLQGWTFDSLASCSSVHMFCSASHDFIFQCRFMMEQLQKHCKVAIICNIVNYKFYVKLKMHPRVALIVSNS
jgi:hypothetical protein